MRAGASKVKITPYGEMMPFPVVGGEMGKVYRDIHVRTIALESLGRTTIFMVFELASAACTKRIRDYLFETYGIAPAYVSFGATHNHESVFPSSLLHPGERPSRQSELYEEFVYAQAVKSADEAIANMRQARFAFTKGESYINVCRDEQQLDGTWIQGRDFTGPSDKTLAVMKLVDTQGRLIAALINYGVHGNSCFLKRDEAGETMMVAGDIPGFVSDFVEKRYEADGAVAAWTIAAGGNQNPIFCIYNMYDVNGVAGARFSTGFDAWKLCEHLGMTQGLDVIRLLEAVPDSALRDEVYVKAVDRIVTVPGIQRPGRAAKPGEPVTIVDAGPVDIHLKLMTLDDIAILSINGELVAETGLRIKEKLPLKDVMIFSLSEESVGYLPDPVGYRNRTFAFYGTRVKDGCTEEHITPAYLEMLRERFTAE